MRKACVSTQVVDLYMYFADACICKVRFFGGDSTGTVMQCACVCFAVTWGHCGDSKFKKCLQIT